MRAVLMQHTGISNLAYFDYQIPRSHLNLPPSPATSVSSELDSDTSATFSDSLWAMNRGRENTTYARDTRHSGNDVARSARSSKRNSRTAKVVPEDEGHVVMEKKVLRALLLYARETRLRLHENETKVRHMEKEMAAFQKSHEQQILVLTKSFIAFQNKMTAQLDNSKQSEVKIETEVRSRDSVYSIAQDEETHVSQQPSQSAHCTPHSTAADGASFAKNDNLSDYDEVEPIQAKPLYAVVNKKRCSQASIQQIPQIQYDVPDFDDPFPPPSPIKVGHNKENNLPSAAVSTVPRSGSPLPSPISCENSEVKVSSPVDADLQTQSRDLKRYRPLPDTPSLSADVINRSRRCTGDGLLVSNNLRDSGRYEALKGEERRPHSQSYAPQPRTKATHLLSKFKKKLKDTKRIVSKSGSRDSLISESPSVSEPLTSDRTNVSVATSNITLMTCKDDGNNNNLLCSTTDSQAKQSEPVLARMETENHNRHPRLDSTEVSDSWRSTDTSYPVLNENPSLSANHSPLYRRLVSAPLNNEAKARWLESKASSSPDLIVGPPNPTVHRSSSLDVLQSDGTSDLRSNESPQKLPESRSSGQSTGARSIDSLANESDFCSLEDITTSKERNMRYILDDVIQQQADIEKFEKGSTTGEPPPKPSRPGFPASRSYQSQSSSSIYQPTAPQPGMYPPSGPRAPVIPPKIFNPRIMTQEELTNHESQAILQRRQAEQAELNERLAKQKLEAEEDEVWMRNQGLNPDGLSPDTSTDGSEPHYHSADDMKKTRAAGTAPPPKPSRTLKDLPAPGPPKLVFEEVKPTPTMKLDRDGDNVYRDTMRVVKSVLQTNQYVMEANPDRIFELVKGIGKALKELCTSLSQEMPTLPEHFHREIDMAQKTTNKDLSQIINQMKLVRKFFATTQVDEYKKCLMAANQVLAMDAKNLLDVVDKARFYKLEHQPSTPPSNDTPPSEEPSTSAPSITPPSTPEE